MKPRLSPAGQASSAVDQATRLLNSDPARAAALCRQALKVAPDHPPALLVLSAALRSAGANEDALKVAERLIRLPLKRGEPWMEHGMCLAALGRTSEAVSSLQKAVKLEPRLAHAWRVLADQLRITGDAEAANDAYLFYLRSSVKDPELLAAATALCDNQISVAERQLRAYLKRRPTDVAAIRMLAEVAARLGRNEDAEALLERCLELAPGFDAARHNYAMVLHRQMREADAIEQLEMLLEKDPDNPSYHLLLGATLSRVGEYDRSIASYEKVIAANPEQPKAWMSFAHVLKTVGRQADSVAAYRKSLEIRPGLGETWWSLANLKTVKFTDADISAMERELAAPGLKEDDQLHLHYALGKAYEDRKQAEESFRHYAAGAAIRREQVWYDPDQIHENVERSRAVFTREFLAERAEWGDPSPDPIFVLGLPRAGSTLVEQILASHSAVEGTMELPDVIAMSRRLGGKTPTGGRSLYPEVLRDLDAEGFRALGAEYLDRTRIQRKLGRPFFIDKMPNNFQHVGMIMLMLPNAKIVDARRHPMACCWSNFKQHFARGQAFTYDLTEIGRYYVDYVDLMAWFDAVAPGRVHRVIHEALVADPETEVRALLDYCGLPFEESCLRPHETERAVRTASSEQVRRPISGEALDAWKPFAPWLGPLEDALGQVLSDYPATPSKH